MFDPILTEIATLLGVESISVDDALAHLVEFQRNNHPDRFQDPSAQFAASERFRKATTLLDRLREAIEQSETGTVTTTAIERVKSPDGSIVRARLEISSLLQQTARLTEELRAMRTELEGLTDENQKLKAELAARLDARITKARKEIVAPYRPTTKTVRVAGIAAALGILTIVLGQIEVVANKVMVPLGLGQRRAGLALFGVLAVTVVVGLLRYIRSWYLEHRVAALCTTGTLRRFAIRMESKWEGDKDKDVEFTESDVLLFVQAEMRFGQGVERVAQLAGLARYSESTFNLAKDLLVAHMFSFHLIEAGPPHNLERVFRMKKRPRFISWEEYKSMLMSEKEEEDEDEDERDDTKEGAVDK